MAHDPEQQLDLLMETMAPATARRILGIPDEAHQPEMVIAPPAVEPPKDPQARHRRPRPEIQPTENEVDPHWNVQRTMREVLDTPAAPKGPGYLAAMAMAKAIGAKDAKGREEIYREIVGSENPDDKVA